MAACLTGYFAYHALHGDRGILAWMRLSQELKTAQSELDRTLDERQALERRVALLSNSSLDPDLLDEQARAMLNFAHPDDLVIFLDGTGSTPGATPSATQ